jgi:phage tail protein X
MGRTTALLLGALVALLCAAAQAAAAPVLVLKDGRVHVRQERFAGPSELPRAGHAKRHRHAARRHHRRRDVAHAASHRAPRGRATRQALDALLAAGVIGQATRDAHQATLRAALRLYKKTDGARHVQMSAVIDNADRIAASGQLIPSRLNAVFATLAANTEWWSDGPLLRNGQRVQLEGSPLVWQYYTNQGIQLQMLANWGKANGFWMSKKPKSLRTMVNALIPLATDRGGWQTWDYYFRWADGEPPWTSSISQGTAVQALARAGQMLSDNNFIGNALGGLAAFEQPAPNGVRVDTPDGPFYVIYSFDSGELVLNAHAQALVGLFDVAQITGDPRARGLFDAGSATLQAVLPSYDTGKWSMYDTNHESDLSYHKLVTGFLSNLCKRTAVRAYCDTAARFESYLDMPPVISAASSMRIRTGAPGRLPFELDKISRAAVTVRSRRTGEVVYSIGTVLGRGPHYFGWPRPAGPGLYDIEFTATDLAGNRAEPVEATLRIVKARKKRRR